MFAGVIFVVLGYAIFYWGIHHFGHAKRYGLLCLMGIGSLSKHIPELPMGEPVANMLGGATKPAPVTPPPSAPGPAASGLKRPNQ